LLRNFTARRKRCAPGFAKPKSMTVSRPFVIDVFSRKFIGWKISTSLHADIALDALEMAFRDRNDCDGVVHHSDRGVQYLSIRYGERLEEAQATASVGAKGDSYDNALMESHNDLYEWELIHRRDDWRDADHVEWETLCYIDWFNNRRLHGANGMIPPVELEDAYYRVINSAEMLFPNRPSRQETRWNS
jgi:putative transposase